MKTTVRQTIFLAAGAWFYIAAVFLFFRKGLWLGGGIFIVAGTYFFWQARRRLR